IGISAALEMLAREHYSFYSPHRTLATAVGLKWEHMDLFSYRLTKQDDIKSMILDNAHLLSLSSFGLAQFRLFEKLLMLSKPRAVIVVNALGSRIYKNQRAPV